MAFAHAAGRTSRLTIEPLGIEHAEELHQALDDPLVGEDMGGPDLTAVDATRRRIELVRRGAPAGGDETWCNWAVLLGGTVIGRVEATLHDGIGDVAYVSGPRWWGRGCATEATSWMAELLSPTFARPPSR